MGEEVAVVLHSLWRPRLGGGSEGTAVTDSALGLYAYGSSYEP